MPKAFKLTIVILGIIIFSVAIYSFFAFVEERQVQKSLRVLERKISEPLGGGMEMALVGTTIKPLFMSEVSIAIMRNGREWRRDFERDDLLRGILAIKQRNPEIVLNLDFSRRNIKITEGGAAAVVVMVKVENFSEPVEPQRLTFTLEKSEDGSWKITAINSGTTTI